VQHCAALCSTVQHCAALCSTAGACAALCSTVQHCRGLCSTVLLPSRAPVGGGEWPRSNLDYSDSRRRRQGRGGASRSGGEGGLWHNYGAGNWTAFLGCLRPGAAPPASEDGAPWQVRRPSPLLTLSRGRTRPPLHSVLIEFSCDCLIIRPTAPPPGLRLAAPLLCSLPCSVGSMRARSHGGIDVTAAVSRHHMPLGTVHRPDHGTRCTALHCTAMHCCSSVTPGPPPGQMEPPADGHRPDRPAAHCTALHCTALHWHLNAD
jgi:hypothetical protein